MGAPTSHVSPTNKDLMVCWRKYMNPEISNIEVYAVISSDVDKKNKLGKKRMVTIKAGYKNVEVFYEKQKRIIGESIPLLEEYRRMNHKINMESYMVFHRIVYEIQMGINKIAKTMIDHYNKSTTFADLLPLQNVDEYDIISLKYYIVIPDDGTSYCDEKNIVPAYKLDYTIIGFRFVPVIRDGFRCFGFNGEPIECVLDMYVPPMSYDNAVITMHTLNI